MTNTMTKHQPMVKRHRAPSGNRDSDRFQGVCSCKWEAAATHSNRTVEGRQLAERDAIDHAKARNGQELDR